jgi:hypothetical protein
MRKRKRRKRGRKKILCGNQEESCISTIERIFVGEPLQSRGQIASIAPVARVRVRPFIKKCCYKTGDFATAASQNGFGRKSFPFASIKEKGKTLDLFLTFIFCHKKVVKQEHYLTQLLSYTSAVL